MPEAMEEEKIPFAHSFAYPGSFRDYSRQALMAGAVFGGVLGIILLVVFAFDRLFYGGTRLTWWHITGVCLLLAGFLVIAVFMARSMSRFRITAGEKGLTISRGDDKILVPYGEISGVDRLRIPGWWPLRAEVKPKGKTARRMIQIKRGKAPPVTFISGLENEKALIEWILKAAGIEEKGQTPWKS